MSFPPLHAALGIARGVQVNGSPYGYDNRITEDFLRQQRGRFVGVAMMPRASMRRASRW